MKMSIYSISLKTFVTIVFIIGMLVGMTASYHWPDISFMIISTIGGFIRGIIAFVFGFS